MVVQQLNSSSCVCGTFGRRPTKLTLTSRCRAQRQDSSFGSLREHFCPAVLSSTAALWIATLSITSPPALANDAYQQRAEAMQKRREMLAQTREKAIAKGGVESSGEPAPAAADSSFPAETLAPSPANTEAPPPTPPTEQAFTEDGKEDKAQREKSQASMFQSLKKSRDNYEDESAKVDKLKAGSEIPENPSWFKGLLDKNKDKQVPAPGEAGPAAKFSPQDAEDSQKAPSAPAPPAKEPQKQDLRSSRMAASTADPLAPESAAAKKEEKYTSKPSTPTTSAPKTIDQKKAGKRRGPLPMWLAQIVLLGSFAGIGYATFFREREVNAVLSVGAKSAVSAYNSLEKKISKN